MDRKKLQEQAQVLRQKKFVRTATPKPIVKNKVVKLNSRMPTSPKDASLVQPSLGEMRRLRAERILAQRRALDAHKQESNSVTPMSKPSVRKRGCSSCGRKIGG